MEGKFNKANVAATIEKEIASLEKRYGFIAGHGRSQVVGEDEEMLISYGRYEALKELHFELFNMDKNYYS